MLQIIISSCKLNFTGGDGEGTPPNQEEVEIITSEVNDSPRPKQIVVLTKPDENPSWGTYYLIFPNTVDLNLFLLSPSML